MDCCFRASGPARTTVGLYQDTIGILAAGPLLQMNAIKDSGRFIGLGRGWLLGFCFRQGIILFGGHGFVLLTAQYRYQQIKHRAQKNAGVWLAPLASRSISFKHLNHGALLP